MPSFYNLWHTLWTGPEVRSYLGEDFDKIGILKKEHIISQHQTVRYGGLMTPYDNKKTRAQDKQNANHVHIE